MLLANIDLLQKPQENCLRSRGPIEKGMKILENFGTNHLQYVEKLRIKFGEYVPLGSEN